MSELLIIGKIGSAHGILGWNYIISYTENKYDILKYIPWLIKKNNQLFTINIEKKKLHKNMIFVKIKNIENRNQAQILVNKNIKIKKKQLPILKNNEYYWTDIIKCSVFNEENQFIGIVIQIMRSKINDILIIQNINTNNKPILIPFIQSIFIININILKKIIYVKKNI